MKLSVWIGKDSVKAERNANLVWNVLERVQPKALKLGWRMRRVRKLVSLSRPTHMVNIGILW